mmetsp:Transcript_2530/g.4741  ORF Transcript_2530/g.4741 Transcript_2530/m.4741 type:complete len:390 (+) Transcript_2530:641-1810(+)
MLMMLTFIGVTKILFFILAAFVAATLTSSLVDAAAVPVFATPFVYNPYGTNSAIEISYDEFFIGEGSVKGSIPIDSTVGNDKIIVTYLSIGAYNQGILDSIWNRPVTDLEYIEYSFKVEACPGTATACPEQFYLNVYTRSDSSVTDYFSCRYDFLPSAGGAEGGDWTTVKFELSTTADRATPRADTAGCPGGDLSLQNAADGNYVLGSHEQLSPPNSAQIFSLNMGDTSLNDKGLAGYFDKVVLKLKDEVIPREFDLGEPHYVNANVGDDNNDGSILSPFQSIQAGINASLPHQIIYVNAGTYEEHISIEKPITLVGPNTGIEGYNTDRNPEAVITFPEGITDNYTTLVYVGADDVNREIKIYDVVQNTEITWKWNKVVDNRDLHKLMS